MTKERVEDAGGGTDDGTAVGERKPSSSAYPMFLAFGLAIAEVGVVLGVFVLTVVGFIAFTGSVAGILAESGYVGDGWTTLAVLGVVVFALGGVVFTVYGGTVGGSELLAVSGPVAYRGLSMLAAGALTLLTAGVGYARGLLEPAV